MYDHLGNTRVVYKINQAEFCMGSDGDLFTLETVQDYFPYGKTLRAFSALPGSGEKFLTTQHQRDGETGLDYRGARFYDSDVGRFLSLDPLAMDFASWSPYNYVFGNPIVYIDPDGRAPADTSDPDKKDEDSDSGWSETNVWLAIQFNGSVEEYVESRESEEACCPGDPQYDMLYGIRDESGNIVGWNDPYDGHFIENKGYNNIGHALGSYLGLGVMPELKLVGTHFLKALKGIIKPSNVAKTSNFTTSQKAAIKGLENQVVKHQKKLTEYIANPEAFDNKGFLQNVSPAVREQIVQSRVRSLENQISTFQKDIKAIQEGTKQVLEKGTK